MRNSNLSRAKNDPTLIYRKIIIRNSEGVSYDGAWLSRFVDGNRWPRDDAARPVASPFAASVRSVAASVRTVRAIENHIGTTLKDRIGCRSLCDVCLAVGMEIVGCGRPGYIITIIIIILRTPRVRYTCIQQ